MLAIDSKFTSLLNSNDTEYLVTGQIDPGDVAGLRRGLLRKLLREKVIKRESPFPRFVTQDDTHFLLAYMPPNRFLVLEIDRSGKFRLSVKIAGDGSDHLDFPRVDFSKPLRFELAYRLIPFLVFGFVGREICVAVLSAVFKDLKKPSAFKISNIGFPRLAFSDALRVEARDIERQIKDKVDAS